MKKRVGFVSNSSSSSFICDVCGTIESGWDACASDFEMSYFTCGHIICDDEFDVDHTKLKWEEKRALKDSEDYWDMKEKVFEEFFPDLFDGSFYNLSDDKKDRIKAEVQKRFDARPDSYYEDIDWEEYIEEQEEVPSLFCPVCNLESISDDTVLSYILKTNNIDQNKIKDEIKNNFKNLDEVKTFLSKD